MKRILLLMQFGVVIHSTAIHSQAFSHFNNMGYNNTLLILM